MTRSFFTDLGVSSELADVLARAGIDTPFPIQDATIPAALDGRDLCGRPPTGSGRTLAFAVPVAARVQSARPNRPRALILTPTRDLAGQIHEVLERLAANRSRRVASIYGGTNIRRDIKQLARASTSSSAPPADSPTSSAVATSTSERWTSSSSTRPTGWRTWGSSRRSASGSTRPPPTLLYSATLDGGDVLVRHDQCDPVRHEVDRAAEEARSGRTGRAGATGRVSLVVEDTREDADGIQRHLGLERVLHPVDLDALHGRPSRSCGEQRDRSRNGSSRRNGRWQPSGFRRGSRTASLEDGQRVRYTPKAGPKGLQATEVTAA